MLAPENKVSETDETAIVDEAIRSRKSVRAFLPDPVDEQTIRDILELAARAPSGTNMQPWKVYVTTGETKQPHRRRHPQFRHPRREGGLGRVQILSRPVLRAISNAAAARSASTSTACSASAAATST